MQRWWKAEQCKHLCWWFCLRRNYSWCPWLCICTSGTDIICNTLPMVQESTFFRLEFVWIIEHLMFNILFQFSFLIILVQAVHVIVDEYHKYGGSAEYIFSSIISCDSPADLHVEALSPELSFSFYHPGRSARHWLELTGRIWWGNYRNSSMMKRRLWRWPVLDLSLILNFPMYDTL